MKLSKNFGFAYNEFLISDVSLDAAISRFKKDNNIKQETIVYGAIDNRKDTNIWYIKAELENKETY
jgi:hypothetical protein